MFFETKTLKEEIMLRVAYLILLITTQSSSQYVGHNLLRKYYVIELIN